jgi:hypothetical protein
MISNVQGPTRNPTSTIRRFGSHYTTFLKTLLTVMAEQEDIMWKYCRENDVEWACCRPGVILGIVEDNALVGSLPVEM